MAAVNLLSGDRDKFIMQQQHGQREAAGTRFPAKL
jgi:hypothetical protein